MPEIEAFVQRMLQIRKDWIAPEAAWKVVENKDEEGLLVFERNGTHSIRVLLHTADGYIDTRSYCATGTILFALRTEGGLLSRNGIQIVLVR